MTRALVLGGGGPVGIGWQAGLLTGLADAGVMLVEADVVIGTSAGSVTGAQLTSGRRLADLIEPMSTAPPWASSAPMSDDVDLVELLTSRGDEDVVSEDEYVAHFAYVGGVSWPAAFRCTAFELASGQPVVWDQSSGVELHRAVASSCCIPGIAPLVTIGDGSYIDGGARDALNTDLAIGHDLVVAMSCMALEPPEGAMPELLASRLSDTRERIDATRASGSAVEVVEPSDEVCELSGWGRFLMDFTRTRAAFDAGVTQAAAEAKRIGTFWSA
jgi:NTE family protein